MVVKALNVLKQPAGASNLSIQLFIQSNYGIQCGAKALRQAITAGVDRGLFVRKGTVVTFAKKKGQTNNNKAAGKRGGRGQGGKGTNKKESTFNGQPPGAIKPTTSTKMSFTGQPPDTRVTPEVKKND
jgi:hypothetical protein